MLGNNGAAPAILFWGTYDNSKSRVPVLMDNLRARGVSVIECHSDCWGDIRDKSLAGWRKLLVCLGRSALAYPRLILRYLKQPRHAAVIVSYPAILDIFVLRLFAWLRRTPLVWDIYIPIYEAAVEDRKLLKPHSIAACLIYAAEWLASRLADARFLDTAAHARYFEKRYRLAPHAVDRVMVGSDRGVFRPLQTDRHSVFTVLYFGQFIPLHGVNIIIEAARILQQKNAAIEFHLIGSGQEAPHIDRCIAEWDLRHVRRTGWIEPEALAHLIGRADLCLGIFGTGGKAARVIPHKLFDIWACEKPVVTRDSEALREVTPGNDAVTLIPAGDPYALAEAILKVKNNPRAYASADFPAVDCGLQLQMFLDGKQADQA